MFEKILQELKTKYKNYGLSDTILKAKAKQIEKAVKEETEIEAAVAGVEEDLAIFQSFADQNRTLAKEIADLKKGKDTATPEPTTETQTAELRLSKPTEEPKPAGNVNDAVLELLRGLKEEITILKTEKAQQTNAQKLQDKLDELKVSKSIQALIPANLTFENDEQIEAYATEMKTKSDAIAQEFGNASLGAVSKPLFGEAAKEGEVSPDVQAYVESKKTKI